MNSQQIFLSHDCIQKINKTMTSTKQIIITATPVILGSIIGYYYRPDEWYSSLQKPWFTPPAIVFQLLWPILYLTIGLSTLMALSSDKQLYYWIIPLLNLVINLSFAPITFKRHNLLWSSIISTMTLITALMMVIEYGMIDKTLQSMYLLIPYIAWLGFATILSWNVKTINKL